MDEFLFKKEKKETVHCPHCKHKFTITSHTYDEIISCPKCGGVFEVCHIDGLPITWCVTGVDNQQATDILRKLK